MITARSLTKDFDGFLALDDVSFEFDDGEIFGIIGHNGAGKTTLLKIVSGLIAPTSGELFINDIDVVKNPLSLKENLGYLPEESRLYETMTAGNYLAFFGEIYGLSPQEIRVRSTQLFAALSLEPDGKTIVLSAHNLYQVEAICDKVMILRRGKMVAFGSMHELRDQFGTLTYT